MGYIRFPRQTVGVSRLVLVATIEPINNNLIEYLRMNFILLIKKNHTCMTFWFQVKKKSHSLYTYNTFFIQNFLKSCEPYKEFCLKPVFSYKKIRINIKFTLAA